ncbi:substrate-binding periplasmic protein [Mycolicibacterium sediminis]|uniref:Basic amino acid ABC transporter substrate-binding protein n=1 Tax=Mycolicibacterium sediminis TaxID=1286180 RepID=A0A7I7QRP6_9MYCO|nr:transporter substrate-binding domain-containing protein [Mycolicibacterium sediminis]BBY28945.1 basic amino acid ABC transporter substrate-binding protein [Mycolicibacterium sediminis]
MSASLAVAGLVATSACSSSSSGSPEDLIANIKANKQVTIGTSNDAPWSTVSDSGEAVGIVPDILREFLKRADIDATIKSTAMPFDSLIPSVSSSRIDLIGDAIFATEERAKQVSFTRTIFVNPDGLVVREGNPDKIESVADLCGRVGATYKGTTWVEDLKAASARCPNGEAIDVKVYSTIFEVMQDITAGRVDGALIDASLAAYALVQNPGLGVQLAPDYVSPTVDKSQNALATNKADKTFASTFNPIYEAMLADGTVAKIFDHWGLKPIDQFLPK